MATQKISEVLTGGIFLGKELKTNGTGIEPGLLVSQDTSGSTVSIGTAASAYGMAYGGRHNVYRPQSRAFATDEALTVVRGVGEVELSSDFFLGGSLPTQAGQKLYAQAGGKWGMQGSVQVGLVLAIRTATQQTGGVGSALTVAHVGFSFAP